MFSLLPLACFFSCFAPSAYTYHSHSPDKQLIGPHSPTIIRKKQGQLWHTGLPKGCLFDPQPVGKKWVREVAEHCSGLVCASPYIILNVCSVYLTYSETQFSPRDQKSILLLLNPVFAVLFWGTNKIYALIR